MVKYEYNLMPKLTALAVGMAEKPYRNTEPRVQLLSIGHTRKGVEPQGSCWRAVLCYRQRKDR